LKLCLTSALIGIGYAAVIHGKDDAVRASAKRVLTAVPGRHRRIILDFLNHKKPLAYTRTFFATLPDSIMTMKVD